MIAPARTALVVGLLVHAGSAFALDFLVQGELGVRRLRFSNGEAMDLAVKDGRSEWKSESGEIAGAKYDSDLGIAQVGAIALQPVENEIARPRGFASVGLFSLGETGPRELTGDMLSVQIGRDPVRKKLTLTLGGGLQTQTFNEAVTPAATVRLMVYPDLAAMERDQETKCEECLFDGEATLGTKLTARGGFSQFDFNRERRKDGIVTARLIGSVVKRMRVPDANAAVVRLITDVEKVVPVEIDSSASGEEVSKPAITMMWDPRPNPARQGVTFRFSLSHRLPAKLVLFDVQGRRVKTLINRVLDAGPQDFTWDRTDSKGNHSKSGMYFARFEADNKSFTKRFVLIR
ncbi:MAG TPA: T9SS type A sorting domain-containing protein [Terriglobia bacterium]|nr:T9SS type A sorting domain-containing protein [Terriglobia bacterium]